MSDASIGLSLSLIVIRVEASGGCEVSEFFILYLIFALNRRESHWVG